MRETLDIIRLAFAGERIAYQGRHFTLPRRGDEGKVLRLSQPANPDIPIYLATLSSSKLQPQTVPLPLRWTPHLRSGYESKAYHDQRSGNDQEAYYDYLGL